MELPFETFTAEGNGVRHLIFAEDWTHTRTGFPYFKGESLCTTAREIRPVDGEADCPRCLAFVERLTNPEPIRTLEPFPTIKPQEFTDVTRRTYYGDYVAEYLEGLWRRSPEEPDHLGE